MHTRVWKYHQERQLDFTPAMRVREWPGLAELIRLWVFPSAQTPVYTQFETCVIDLY